MGQVIPDRLFWALPEDEETDDEEGPEVHPGADYFEVPLNETKH
jgi:hydroxymethylpyrimidine/phosphomethylpyrimidine kinase